MVSAVLLFGNINFDGSTLGNETPCRVNDIEILNDVAFLIGVNPE